PSETVRGEVRKIYNEYLHKVDKLHGTRKILELVKETQEELLKVKIDSNRKVLKIGIIGEIYTIIEPFVNLYLEEKLGDMGVQVDRSMTI
ncbi:hypothetical protein KQ733_14825, partial [Listeria monocytogenes]|nr:hypothetical protein [Listeria monocytogenes]